MTETPHFLDSIDVDDAPATSGRDCDEPTPDVRYARLVADDAARVKGWATDSDDAHHHARLARVYGVAARNSADRAHIDANSADHSAQSSQTAATNADRSAEIAYRAAQSATFARQVTYTLIMFVLGIILGLMLAIMLYLWVVTITHDVAPRFVPYQSAATGSPPAGAPGAPHAQARIPIRTTY